MDVRKLGDRELVELYKGLKGALEVDCYGVGDLVLLAAVAEEMRRRGLKP